MAMKLHPIRIAILSGTTLVLAATPQNTKSQNWSAQQPPYGRPDATIDLRTNDGVDLVKVRWRYSDATIADVDSPGPCPALKPPRALIRTYDYTPHAGAAGFDDSNWEVIAPTTLDARRAGGKVCF